MKREKVLNALAARTVHPAKTVAVVANQSNMAEVF